MLAKLKHLFGKPPLDAASQLAPPAPPKVKRGVQSYPSHMQTTKVAASAIPKSDRRLVSTDFTTFRSGRSTQEVMRNFAAASPDLSASIFNYLRVAITPKYTAVAKNLDGTFNREATEALQQLLVRFDILNDYSDGFSGTWSMRSVSEALGRELLLYGACAGELVLGKDLLPRRIQPISVTAIDMVDDKDKILRPVQLVGGEEVDLDVPTFFMTYLDTDLLSAYPNSPLESSLQPVLSSEEFMQDVRRVLKRAIHPRPKVTVDEEQLRKGMPAAAQHDEETAAAYFNSVISDIENKINGLQPEDALVMLSSLKYELENNGNVSLASEYAAITDMIFSKLATGAKTLPAILGRDTTSNASSTSAMLFTLSASGAVQLKLNEIYSRMLTLSVRLLGYDVYAEFKYAPVSLRPEDEMTAFRQTRQMMILEQLSLGLITDEEAAIELTGHLPPAGATPLSGTGFRTNAVPGGQGGENPFGRDTNSGSTLNQNLNSDAPDQARGQNKKVEQ